MWVPCYSVRTTTPPQRAAGPEPAGPGYFGAGPRQCSLNRLLRSDSPLGPPLSAIPTGATANSDFQSCGVA
jgi:hypothetical protein